MIYKGDMMSWSRWMEYSARGYTKVEGNFSCSYNNLKSLKNCPESVTGTFICNGNKLTSLEGGPEYVGQDYYCSGNNLTSLEGLPEYIGGNIFCTGNKIGKDEVSTFIMLKYGEKIIFKHTKQSYNWLIKK